MKGLLLKEFYIWLKTRSWYMLIMLVYSVLFTVTGGSRSFFFVYIIVMSLTRAFSDDETSNWKNYSLALPYTPAQIVSVRYLFLLTEVIIATIVTIVSTAISFYHSEGFNFGEYVPYLTDNWIIASNMTAIITILFLGFAFAIPLNYKFTGTARNIISIIPIMISMITILFISLTMTFSDYIPGSEIPKGFYNEKWLFAASIAAVMLALAASWCLCVVFTAKNKSRTKKLKAITAVLIAAFVVLSAVSISVISSKKSFYVSEDEENGLYKLYWYENYTPPTDVEETRRDVVTDEQQKCREEIEFLWESFFNISHEGHHLEDCRKEIDKLGLYEKTNGYDEYCLREDGAYVRLYPETNTDRIFQINISADVGETYIKEATTEELDEIGKNFKIGMTEQELWDVYEEYELYPCYIAEEQGPDSPTTRYYYAKFYVESYNSGDPTLYEIHTDFVGGKLVDVRFYDQ